MIYDFEAEGSVIVPAEPGLLAWRLWIDRDGKENIEPARVVAWRVTADSVEAVIFPKQAGEMLVLVEMPDGTWMPREGCAAGSDFDSLARRAFEVMRAGRKALKLMEGRLVSRVGREVHWQVGHA